MPQDLYAAMHHKEIMDLLRIEDGDDAALDPFGDLLRRMDYYAGISGSFQEIEQLHDYLIQANYVAERHGNRLDGESLYYF